AGGKARQEFVAIELAADEHQLAGARGRTPGPVGPAIKHHVYAVEYITALVTLDVEHALHAQDVLAAALQQVGQPVIDLARVQRLLLLDADGPDLGIMVMRGKRALHR